ncbi:hypothetical protein ALC56_09883 [Trachymyrmex septentrionalis]|uniref:Uncharacterized protein n=1 Tax=Trachymyrmex septentrionalis TaxID=34720 RepID=A0A151JUE6_9HYME|nr:hypothetical protein ALC56_09883 [Trachymyrmex septentrionalis]
MHLARGRTTTTTTKKKADGPETFSNGVRGLDDVPLTNPRERSSLRINVPTNFGSPSRRTGETLGPECDATKTVDKEQGSEKERMRMEPYTCTGRREKDEREQESSLITISLPAIVHRKRPRKGSEGGECEDPWQYRFRTMTRTVNMDHGSSKMDIATL